MRQKGSDNGSHHNLIADISAVCACRRAMWEDSIQSGDQGSRRGTWDMLFWVREESRKLMKDISRHTQSEVIVTAG